MKGVGNAKLPQKGEVDFIIGGPPCQGFSVLNTYRFPFLERAYFEIYSKIKYLKREVTLQEI